MIYCRRCDLAFCTAHEGEHDNTLEGHELQENPNATFCCVCSGIYRPLRPAPQRDPMSQR